MLGLKINLDLFSSYGCQLLGVSTTKGILRQYIKQGILVGSASKPALRQDTGYIVEKTYHDITPYLGAFGSYLMPQ